MRILRVTLLSTEPTKAETVEQDVSCCPAALDQMASKAEALDGRPPVTERFARLREAHHAVTDVIVMEPLELVRDAGSIGDRPLELRPRRDPVVAHSYNRP